jgi:ABC-type cobalamin/Fe3+-siderophores transport system ATPase subunit
MNPYTPLSSRLFYGREQLIRDLLADKQQGQPTVLIGGRRCGKTTILRRVKDYLQHLGSGAADAGLWFPLEEGAVA